MLINCEFDLVFDNNFKIHKKNSYCYNINDITEIKSYLFYWNHYHKLQGYGFCNVDEMNIKTTSDKCNMTQKHYINQPMQMIKRRMIFAIDRCPQLINALDRTKNYPSIRKYSDICVQLFIHILPRFCLQNVQN